jgi:hypothetical protein
MKKLDELAHLLANPVLPKASRHWSGADVLIASAPRPDHFRRSLYPRDSEILTEHALEVSYFLEAFRDPFYEESLIDQCSKIEFFGRLASAAAACLLAGATLAAAVGAGLGYANDQSHLRNLSDNIAAARTQASDALEKAAKLEAAGFSLFVPHPAWENIDRQTGLQWIRFRGWTTPRSYGCSTSSDKRLLTRVSRWKGRLASFGRSVWKVRGTGLSIRVFPIGNRNNCQRRDPIFHPAEPGF